MTGTVRFHGGAPFRAAAVHGGPGAPGSAAGLAREMARWCGTLEPLQTENSIGKLIEELAGVLRQDGWPPMVLAGHSWGGMAGGTDGGTSPGTDFRSDPDRLSAAGGAFRALHRIAPPRHAFSGGPTGV